MVLSLAADAILALHLGFVLFAVFGGLLVLWRPRLAWVHVPTLAWGVWIMASHGVCPLTPLENALRQEAGEAGYAGSFIEHYVTRLIYPEALTPTIQTMLAIAFGMWSAAIYGVVLWQKRRRRVQRL